MGSITGGYRLRERSAQTSRGGASLQNGLSRKPRNDVDHLQVEAALLSVAGERHLEERAIEAGSRCRGPHDRADAFQQAYNGQGAVSGDATLQFVRRPEMSSSAFARRQMVHRHQHEIVEVPSIGLEALKEIAVANPQGE